MKHETITEELLQIAEENNGFCSPAKVVEFARNKKTLLHSKFQWDNDKAAEQYRLWQARQIISLELTVVNRTEKSTEPVRMFWSLDEDRETEKGYRLITDILSSEELTDKLLHQALNELTIFSNKYHQLEALRTVFTAIDALKENIK